MERIKYSLTLNKIVDITNKLNEIVDWVKLTDRRLNLIEKYIAKEEPKESKEEL